MWNVFTSDINALDIIIFRGNSLRNVVLTLMFASNDVLIKFVTDNWTQCTSRMFWMVSVDFIETFTPFPRFYHVLYTFREHPVSFFSFSLVSMIFFDVLYFKYITPHIIAFKILWIFFCWRREKYERIKSNNVYKNIN